MKNQLKTKKPKIAIFHAFFKANCKGGGEKLILQLREELQADLWVGAIDMQSWGKHLAGKDYFATKVWNIKEKFEYLHQDLKIPFLKQIYRQLNFLFSPKIEELKNYDIIIFSGNIGFVPRRLKNTKVKTILYCHTPPRPITDQFELRLQKIPKILHFVVKFFRNWMLNQYTKDCKNIDYIIANSKNIQNRLQKYTKIVADEVIYPPIETNKFKYISQQNYFLSFARLEDLKRIKILVKTFELMPDKKLIICSTGPLKDWLINELKIKNITNIEYKGLVSDDELSNLVGNCLAGIYIPIDEDFGMIQVELMSAGKPVIGVKEGGLLETIIDQKTGFLAEIKDEKGLYLQDSQIIENLVKIIKNLNPKEIEKMRLNCEQQAKNFDSQIFYNKMQKVIANLAKGFDI